MTPDEIEAHSLKYNIARIVRLSSGNFALFNPWTQDGIELVGIGTLAYLDDLIPTAVECDEFATEALPSTHDAPTGKALLSQLGFSLPPTQPLKRRI